MREIRERDHPRACGENKSNSWPISGRLGSPPRMRGKPLLRYQRRTNDRDHPRACGENQRMTAPSWTTFGSPPRVRGKPGVCGGNARAGRITPACAGKTVILCLNFSVNSDHPRVCGENMRRRLYGDIRSGSPPRVRGKLPINAPVPCPTRITPACAGKTHVYLTGDGDNTDHPRVCGENRRSLPMRILSSGSPPRVRGKLPSKHIILHYRRITPACAGKTLAFWL